jgi:hypothetical protein
VISSQEALSLSNERFEELRRQRLLDMNRVLAETSTRIRRVAEQTGKFCLYLDTREVLGPDPVNDYDALRRVLLEHGYRVTKPADYCARTSPDMLIDWGTA